MIPLASVPAAPQTQQSLFKLISGKHAALIELFLMRIQDKSRAEQDSLCFQINDLGERIRNLRRSYPANANGNGALILEREVKWLCARADLIFKTLKQ